ncbi:hypothetical protein GGE60_002406 [Rhizobium leucaenae]|uniref:UPF0260 protein GGE60_002406 n=2 Tax=Rhizobium/Agrobacterium group TaxID=227290 RepID=A0A7W7EJY6_9HYPH|nr:hypothetical protein [Rhizobium leucaenae]
MPQPAFPSRAARTTTMDDIPFWKSKTLTEMSTPEWESLCDGCGLCCLNKLEEWDSGDVYFTSIRCKLMDGESCRCTSYPNRWDFVPDCVQLTPEKVPELEWLPPTCAYRLVNEGRDLYWWHPLISGDPETVHIARVSARGRTVSENDVDLDDFEEYIVDWPLTVEDDMEASPPAKP